MTIVYETDKMTALLNTDAIITEVVGLSTSATGAESPFDQFAAYKTVYRDTFDLWTITARDDASSSKLVGLYCFGDINQYHVFNRDSHTWSNAMRDAIIAKSIDESKVDYACAIYVHADYTGQGISRSMQKKRTAYQISRGMTHSIIPQIIGVGDVAKNLNTAIAAANSAENIGADSDDNAIYLFTLSNDVWS
jgi:GNAT superfamily N-acetyltransferase|tara:strand:+ start:758 stop:1336 length:579 start_codon:yes stop_codon:yes gene_type:complete